MNWSKLTTSPWRWRHHDNDVITMTAWVCRLLLAQVEPPATTPSS